MGTSHFFELADHQLLDVPWEVNNNSCHGRFINNIVTKNQIFGFVRSTAVVVRPVWFHIRTGQSIHHSMGHSSSKRSLFVSDWNQSYHLSPTAKSNSPLLDYQGFPMKRVSLPGVIFIPGRMVSVGSPKLCHRTELPSFHTKLPLPKCLAVTNLLEKNVSEM